ncbi:MAG TPA: prolyl oligopeptidase family serine peptidase [Pyrinomonadaceae bacterium]|jgi:prolyl oligopeptidase
MNKVVGHLIAKLATNLLLLAFTFSTLSQTVPPKAERREVKDTYFGQTISDSYRWLENSKSEEAQKWIKTQADYARAYLDKLPMRDDILKELNELSDAGTRVYGIQRRGNWYFYYRRAPNENDFKIYMREGLNGAERLLLDPDKIASDGKRRSINNFSLSQDGKYLSYVSSVGGSENGELRVIETATGKDTGVLIDRARFSSGDWLPDGKSFLYNRLQKMAPDSPPTDLYQKSRVYLHVLGGDADADKPVFGYEVNPNIKMETTPLPFIWIPLGSKYAVAIVNSGVSPNSEFYVAPLAALTENGNNPIDWQKISKLDDEVSNIELHGDDIYLSTYKNTPRYKIVHVNLKNPDLKQADTVFPASEAVVEYFTAARDALYVQTLDGGTRKIYRVDYKTKKSEPLKLPYQGSASIAGAYPDMDGIYFNLDSWTKSAANFLYDPKTGNASDTRLIPPLPIDMSRIEFINAKAKSYDGTMIPLVVIYKKGIKRDGKNPVLLNGYGAYGIENTSPFFYTSALPWLDRGGVMALAGIRGGGEYGEEWHLAGKGATKPNTWKDFIACAEYLIAEKYTSPEYLGIIGGSAGGILISNAITERPELFGAAISAVGLNNALLAETTANGVPNIPEFGSFKTEEGFKNLLAMDGYHKVKDGVKYPAVMLTHGINDPRVEPWMSAKMAARLLEASASGKPVLLRIDYDAGHGFGSTKKQRNEENADVYAFLLQQLAAKSR